MIERTVLLRDIESLPPRYYNEVVDFVDYLKEKKVKENLFLENAAELASEEYQNDKELTAFCALDGENFYEPR